MWGKVAVALSAVAVVAVAGAGYVAVVGIEVDATKDNLVGQWTADKGMALTLNSDGTFTANALDRCFGPIHPIVHRADGVRLQEVGITITSGTGRWHLDTYLELDFQSPQQLTESVQVGKVTWNFRPTAVALNECTLVPE